MESLALDAEETKQAEQAPKAHLTTIDLLSIKPLTAQQLGQVFNFLKARQVPYHRVRQHKQQQVASYLASVLPPEHRFPPSQQPFSMED